MGVYRQVCYKVENVFIKLLTKGKNPKEIQQKTTAFRIQKEALKLENKQKAQRKSEEKKKLKEKECIERERIAKEKAQKQHEETLALLSHFVSLPTHPYTDYEYRAVEKNSAFFESVKSRVFEENESGITFLQCKFDRTKTKELPGFLFATDKRVWFVAKNMTMVDKFRYQTIHDVKWFRDGWLEKWLHIQYGKHRLEFDEIFDQEQMLEFDEIFDQKQMQRVANIILTLSVN